MVLCRFLIIFDTRFSVTPKRGLDKRGLGNQSFLQKSLKNIEEQPKIVEKSYKIDAKSNRRRLRRRPKGAALRAAPLGVVVFRLVRISLVFAHFGAPKFREIWPPTKTLRVFLF